MERVKSALNDLIDAKFRLSDIYHRCSKATIITKEDMEDILNTLTSVIDSSTIIFLKTKWSIERRDTEDGLERHKEER